MISLKFIRGYELTIFQIDELLPFFVPKRRAGA